MIAIVGGGIAGLAAARRLQAAGREVTVFEASDAIGGLAATVETAGDPIEQYYHHLSKSEERIVEVIEDLGLGGALDWPIGETANYVDGTVWPMDKPWEILTYPYLSLYDTVRLGMLVLGIDVRGGRPRLDSYDSLEAYDVVPIEEFVAEHTTRGVYEHFFEPLIDAKFGERAEDVSAAWLLGRVQFRGERDPLRGEYLGYLDGGFGRLIDALIEDVGRDAIRTATRVTDLAIEAGRVDRITVETAPEDRDEGDPTTETVAVDDVIVAAMPSVLESLTDYTCEIDFQGTVCSVIAMDQQLTDTYWLNVVDDAPFGALIEHTNFVSPERYGGEHLLYAVRYVQGPEDPFFQQSDEAIEDAWLDGLEDLFEQFDRSSVEWIQTGRNPRTAPVYERGYLDRVVPYDPDIADGLYYAGMGSRAQYPERSLDGGIRAGENAAERLLSHRETG
ncbi:MAG: NAD(P)/FAD-dependent oxidoreductase [Halococcoides sp.]